MRQLRLLAPAIILAVSLFLPGLPYRASANSAAAVAPTIGAAGSYSVLAGSTVTNTGPTTTNGDVGVAPGSAITGFPPGVAGPPGTVHANDANAQAAQADNLVVFGALDQPCDQSFGAVDLTSTFPTGVGPGVYCSTSSFSLSGNLNLTGSGVWIFKTASTLITSPGSSVTGGDPCQVWWRVGSSATLDTSTQFIGSLLALASITMNTGATVNGRVMAQTGQVSLQSNIISGPVCSAQPVNTPTTLALTNTPAASSPTNTPAVGSSTATPLAATLLPVVTGLPGTGGAPIQNSDFPWFLVFFIGFGALVSALGYWVYRSAHLR